MYTLEDDNETSSRIRKKELAEAQKKAKMEKDARPARSPRPLPPDEAPIPTEPENPTPTSSNPGRNTSTRKLDDTVYAFTPASAIPPEGEEDITRFTYANDATVPVDARSLATSPTIPTLTDRRQKRRAFAALTIACIAVFFTALDQTVVVTALPKMFPDLQLAYTQLDHAAWIISAYLLGFVIAMPLMGRVSDIHGRRRIFLLCLSIFGIGSIFCALAPTMAYIFDLSSLSSLGIDTSSEALLWLVAARFVQAIGGGAIVPIAMAVASDFYGQEKRGLALGIVGAVTEAGGAFGPLYGALVVDRLGWQAIFYLNAPIVVVLLIAGWFFIPRGRRLRQKIDWLGSALLALSLTCMSIGLAQQGTSLGGVTTQSSGSNNPTALILAGVFLIAFILVELKVRWPIVSLNNFKRLTFSASSLVSLLVGAALIIAMTDIPIYVDTVLQQSILESGLALLRLTVMIPIGAILGGWLCNRISCRWVGVAGLAITAVGFFLMSLWPVVPSELQITISTMTAGFGFGLVIAPIGTTAINAVWPSQAGVSSAIVTALRMIGMTLGLSVLTSWALSYFQHLVSQYPSLSLKATPDQFAAWSKGYATHIINSEHTTYTTVFLISMFICLAALVPAFFLWGRQAPMQEPVGHTLDLLYDDEMDPLPPLVLKRRRRRRLIIATIVLVILFVGAGIIAATQLNDYTDNNPVPVSDQFTPVVSGPRLSQLALDKDALTSIFASQLGTQQSVLSDLAATPGPNDGLTITFNLHIDASGIHRVIPVEIDGTVGLDNQQNMQITVQQFKRDGIEADASATTAMQDALNAMLINTVMATLHSDFKNTKILSVHTSTSISCAKNTEMFVIEVEAPAVAGIAAQPTPVPFCFKGPVDLNKLLN